MLKFAVSHPTIRTVVLIGRWALSAEGQRYKAEPGAPVIIVDAESNDTEPNRAVFARGLDRTVAALGEARKKVILVGPVPEVGHDVPRLLASGQRPVSQTIAPTMDEFQQRQVFVLETLRSLGERYDVTLVFPHERLCVNDHCQVHDNGRPLYSDDNHLTTAAARSLSPLFEDGLR
jgi:hypothetical protein